MSVLQVIDSWPVGFVSAAVIDSDGRILDSRGESGRVVPLASVTKLLAAYALLVAVEEGAIELEEPAGPPGATVRHLLAHAAGYGFSDRRILARPGTKRIYSSAGFEVLAEHLEAATGIPFAQYLGEAVCEPLGMHGCHLVGSAGHGASGSLADLVRFSEELVKPQLIDPGTLAQATQVQFPGLDGVLPGYGIQRPNDWGLGFELRDHKQPHWTGTLNSAATFGHFGQSGTFLWVDPEAQLAAVILTDRAFGDWAKPLWTGLNDSIVSAYRV